MYTVLEKWANGSFSAIDLQSYASMELSDYEDGLCDDTVKLTAD